MTTSKRRGTDIFRPKAILEAVPRSSSFLAAPGGRNLLAQSASIAVLAAGVAQLSSSVLSPARHQAMRAPILLAAFIGACTLWTFRTTNSVTRNTRFFTVAILAVSLVSVVRGLSRNNPGTMDVWQFYIVWPIVGLVFAEAIGRRKLTLPLARSLFILGNLNAFYAFLYVLKYAQSAYFGWVPDLGIVNLEAGIAHYQGLLFEYDLTTVATFHFFVPFFWMNLFRGKDGLFGRKFTIFSCLSVTIASLIAGRVSLLIVLGLTLVIAPVLAQTNASGAARARALFKGSAIAFLALALIGGSKGVTYIQTALGGNSAASSERFAQMKALWVGFKQNPFLGQGLGATAERFGSIRSEATPWAYELYYNNLLFAMGVVAFLTMFSATMFLVYNLAIETKRMGDADPSIDAKYRTISQGYLLGMSLTLLAAGTNSYLAQVDFLWIIFLGMGLILERANSDPVPYALRSPSHSPFETAAIRSAASQSPKPSRPIRTTNRKMLPEVSVPMIRRSNIGSAFNRDWSVSPIRRATATNSIATGRSLGISVGPLTQQSDFQ